MSFVTDKNWIAIYQQLHAWTTGMHLKKQCAKMSVKMMENETQDLVATRDIYLVSTKANMIVLVVLGTEEDTSLGKH